MRKFLTALIVVLTLTAQVGAVPLTREQVDKIFIDIESRENTSKLNLNALVVLLIATAQFESVPLTQEQIDKEFIDIEVSENISTLDLDVDTLKEEFNEFIEPILQETMSTDDVSAMEHLFLIKDYKVFSKPDGDIFANFFGEYRVALVGVSEPNGGNFKILSFYYTTPEEKDESIFTIWLITTFVKCVAPGVNAQDLMSELTAENSSGILIKDGIKFSIASEGNLNVLTAVAAH